jgi:tellurite resistance protein TerC
MPEFLTVMYAGQPVWLWLAFLSFIALLLWVDLGLLNKKDEVVSPKKYLLRLPTRCRLLQRAG